MKEDKNFRKLSKKKKKKRERIPSVFRNAFVVTILKIQTFGIKNYEHVVRIPMSFLCTPITPILFWEFPIKIWVKYLYGFPYLFLVVYV